MQQGKKISSPYEEGLQKLADALAYLQNITKERKQYLHASTAGPVGTIYHVSRFMYQVSQRL
jgi:hypothetical protein